LQKLEATGTSSTYGVSRWAQYITTDIHTVTTIIITTSTTAMRRVALLPKTGGA